MRDALDEICLSNGGQKITAHYTSGTSFRQYDGEKTFMGYGDELSADLDYWTVRRRSSALFRTNTYARGIVGRFVTNVINTGLTLESAPDTDVLGITDEWAADWSDAVEAKFGVYWREAKLCDYAGRENLGSIQRTAFREALLDGDVLVVLVGSDPKVKLIPGSLVSTPMKVEKGRNVVEGVEVAKDGSHVAYYVQQDDGTHKRVLARGRNTGRLQAWLYYATEKRHSDVRGEPLLSLIMQSLKELDRYRDSAQRKASVSARIHGFIKRTMDVLKSKPISTGAVRNTGYNLTPSDDGGTREYKFSEMADGVYMESLQPGEEPVAYQSNIDVDFGKFEDTIVSGLAWAYGMPPEILKLSFNSNYAASQGSKDEFKMWLNMIRSDAGATLLSPIYKDWLVSQHAKRELNTPNFLEDYLRDPYRFGAWVTCDWAGAIKPSSDILKTVKAYAEYVDHGSITRHRMTRELTGTKFSANIKQLKRENELIAEAMRPVAEFEAEFNSTAPNAMARLKNEVYNFEND